MRCATGCRSVALVSIEAATASATTTEAAYLNGLWARVEVVVLGQQLLAAVAVDQAAARVDDGLGRARRGRGAQEGRDRGLGALLGGRRLRDADQDIEAREHVLERRRVRDVAHHRHDLVLAQHLGRFALGAANERCDMVASVAESQSS